MKKSIKTILFVFVSATVLYLFGQKQSESKSSSNNEVNHYNTSTKISTNTSNEVLIGSNTVVLPEVQLIKNVSSLDTKDHKNFVNKPSYSERLIWIKSEISKLDKMLSKFHALNRDEMSREEISFYNSKNFERVKLLKEYIMMRYKK